MALIDIGIVGATGYTGVELARLLSAHPHANLKVLTSNSEQGKAVADVFPSLRSDMDLNFEAHESDMLKSCDLVFFATPHATAMHYAKELLAAGCKVIDLSADFRINDKTVWETWYKTEHACPELLEQAVYGLPELHREQIKQAKLVANPGCYPTATALALLPAIKHDVINASDIIVDAKSGVSGAGRKAALATQFSEVSESFKAYSASGHRHLPEIEQTLNAVKKSSDVGLTFVPHLVPMNRGIHATVYVKLNDHNIDLQSIYNDFYMHEHFVDILRAVSHPYTRSVRSTNLCQISLHPAKQASQPSVILSVIDNLVKGAAGQAIQNMNLMFGFVEDLSLNDSGLIP